MRGHPELSGIWDGLVGLVTNPGENGGIETVFLHGYRVFFLDLSRDGCGEICRLPCRAAEGVELPEKVTPEDAAKFTAVLNRLIGGDPEEEENPRLKQLKEAALKNPLIKQLKAATKTERSKEAIN